MLIMIDTFVENLNAKESEHAIFFYFHWEVYSTSWTPTFSYFSLFSKTLGQERKDDSSFIFDGKANA